ncbi:putative bifunctional diguanylate cyclase/phosphodiesterase [Undibacterium sp. JH2W]|uniref:putative bifunctional diguanylate cyclase/phosphodiesterase n=1 Tax=Undibacterium sp. JH2W TaxID=3413037 RepID=UPI003BF0F5E5
MLNPAMLKGMLGMVAGHELSVKQRKPHVRRLIYIALPCAILLALANYLKSGYPLPGLIFALIAALMLGAAFFLSTQDKLLAMSESLLLLFALGTSVALGLLGGISGSGVLWIYAFPFLALWLKGQRQGVQWSLLWLLCMSLSIWNASELSFGYVYEEQFKVQASIALLLYTGIALAYNFSRSQLQEKLYVSEQGVQAKKRDYLTKLEQAAYQDGVTGLPNCLRLLELLHKEISIAQERGHTLLVAHIRLKKMFETANIIGADASDKLIRNIAATMTAAVGSRGSFARIRRDEFVCIYRKHSEDITATDIIKEILDFRLEYKINEYAVHIDHTIGIASFPRHGQDAETLLRKASQAMLQAQFAHQSLAFFDERQEQQFTRQQQLFVQLHEALHKGGLSLHYQALIDLKTGVVVGAEALARWIDPVSGPVTPTEFIPIAEKSGLIKPFTLWVMREAFGQLARWRAEGLNLSVSINLSARCIVDRQLVDDLCALLTEFNLPAESIILELRESSFADAAETAMQTIQNLHKLGFRLSIDDFGAGYSSLAYLKDLKIDELKIDQSFMRTMGIDASSRAIVLSTIQLAHNLNLKVVAEGIESARVEQQLQEMGCDLGQGYYFCKPMPADVFSQWARSWQINRRAVLSA